MKARTGKFIASAAVLAAGVLFVLWRPAASEAVYPVERATGWFSRCVASRVRGVFSGASASAENVRLRREVAVLSLLRDDVERLEAENARLRMVLGYAESHTGRLLPAAVLSRGGASASGERMLRIGRGSSAGVREGAVVESPDGLVGRVKSVSPHTAEVALITDPSVKVSCEVESPGVTRARGILFGGDGDTLEMKRFSKGGPAGIRSRVVTSGMGGVFPRGLVVGYVRDAGEGDAVYLSPAVDFGALEDVFVRIDEK